MSYSDLHNDSPQQNIWKAAAMLRHNINGWNVFHEHKQDAPPIISIRICITRSEAYQSVALSYLYVNLLTQQIKREAQHFSIAGDIYTSLSHTHYTIGVDTLDEDLEDFLVLVQKMLRQKIPLDMIQEEKEQQTSDMWNATQPQALIHASIMELYYGQSILLGLMRWNVERARSVHARTKLNSSPIRTGAHHCFLFLPSRWKPIFPY